MYCVHVLFHAAEDGNDRVKALADSVFLGREKRWSANESLTRGSVQKWKVKVGRFIHGIELSRLDSKSASIT
jgi:hypothetical protein